MQTAADNLKAPRRVITTSLTDETLNQLEEMRRPLGFSRSGAIAAIIDHYFQQQEVK
jgi:metal-responsive CopG/Arc/MetJ family transcriptional regulator